jgi:hypothetical protein
MEWMNEPARQCYAFSPESMCSFSIPQASRHGARGNAVEPLSVKRLAAHGISNQEDRLASGLSAGSALPIPFMSGMIYRNARRPHENPGGAFFAYSENLWMKEKSSSAEQS